METACIMNNCVRVQELLAAGADIDAMVGRGDYTALHVAAYAGNIDIVTLLVERGANINVRGWKDLTPLHRSIMRDNVECISYLLSHHADVTLVTHGNDNTCLHLVVCHTCRPTTITQLLTAGVSVDARNKHGYTALHCLWLWDRNEYNNMTQIALLLLAAGADIDAQTTEGNTILHLRVNNIRAVRFLLEHGASTDVRNKVGKLALDLAKDEAISTLLLEHIASQGVKNAGRRK